MDMTSKHFHMWQKALLAAIFTCGLVLPGVGHSLTYAETSHALNQEANTKKVSKLTVDTKDIKLKKAGTQQLALTVTYSDKTTEDVTQKADWSTSDSGIATVAQGLVSAVDSGKAKIKAYHAGKSVTVPVEIEVIAKLAADQKKLALSLGATKQVSVTATYSDKTTAIVTEKAEWATANSEVATVINGLVTATGSGKTKVILTYGDKTVTIPVEVDVIAKLAANQKKLYIRPGASQPLTLAATLTNGTKVDVSAKAEWSTDNSEIATVASGLVTGVGPGKAKITAKYGGKTVTIPVESNVIAKMEFDVRQVALKAGETKAVKATVTYTDKSTADVTAEADWTSADKGLASVDDGKITANKAGKTTVWAAYSGKVVKIQVTVK